jgi:hypothetical protein
MVNSAERELREKLAGGAFTLKAAKDMAIEGLEEFPEAREYMTKLAYTAVSNRKALSTLPDPGDWFRKKAPAETVDLLHKQAASALKSLTPDELRALNRFKSDGYTAMKAVEQGLPDDELAARFNVRRDGEVWDGVVKEAKELVPQLQSAAEKLHVPNPTAWGPLYRGVVIDDAGLSEILSKDDYVVHSAMSTSYSPLTARGFASGDGHSVVFRITDMDGAAIAANSAEEEMIAGRGAKFQITGRQFDPREGGVVLVDMKQVGHTDPRASADAGVLAAILGVGGAATAATAAGEAGAAELLPEQQQARDALSQQMATLSPEQQAVQSRTAEAFARIGKQTETKVRGAVEDLFALAKDPRAKPRHRSPKAREIDRRAAELDVPRNVARFMGRKTDDPVQAWEQKTKLLSKVMADPSQLARTMAQNLGDMPELQPEIFTKLVAQTMRTVEYLHAKLPGSAGKSVLDPKGYPPGLDEISELAAHWVGALHPLDTLDDLASNDLQPEQMEAVQTLWPDAYVMFQQAALSHINELSQRGGLIPMAALEQIDSALNLDGAGEPLLSWDMAGLIRQAEAQAAATGQPPPAPSPMQSQQPERIASSAMSALHEAGA